MKKVLTSILAISLIALTISFNHNSNSNNASALTYTDNVGLNFTFNPSITVSLSNASGGSSADLVINDLTPGTSSDSNTIIVNVLSNNQNGYTLEANVGNSTTYDTRNLIMPSGAANFASIDYGSTIATLEGLDDNTWGYSYLDETLTGSTWSSYSGLPLYSDTEHTTTLKTTNGPSLSTGDKIDFKIAAKASTTQSSGEYNNVINFIAVGNTNPTSFYDAFKEAQTTDPTITQLNGYWKMQDMSPTICNAVEIYDDDSHIQLIDTRDNEVYWIGKLKDDRCWLLDNLRLGSNDYEIPLTPEDTNIETAWTLPKGIVSNFRSYTEPQINASHKNNTNVTSYGTASGKVGIYYNYCATSGGTYCYAENEGPDTPTTLIDSPYDVCPHNWRIPTGTDDSNSEYLIVRDSYGGPSQSASSTTSLQYNLSMVLATHFAEGYYNEGTYGATQTSTYRSSSGMTIFSVSESAIGVGGGGNSGLRYFGRPIRCIANNT